MEKTESGEGKVPALPDLFDFTGNSVRIRSARCGSCGTYFFPEYHAQHRSGCSREGVEKVLLSNRGKIASWTIEHYMCPPPFRAPPDIAPYGIALVEFPEGIQVAGLIMESDLSTLKIGQDVETITYPLYKNDAGQDVVTWAFRVRA
jgi:uncharacterized OB-fold protein